MVITEPEWREIQVMQAMHRADKMADYLKVSIRHILNNGLMRPQTKEGWICRVNEMNRMKENGHY